MSLPNLQAEFAEAILSSEPTNNLVFPAANIVIYRNNFISTLTETLLTIYPLIAKLVSKDFFRIVAKDYIQQYPSRSSNLHDYGAYFSDFLATYTPVHDLIYLTEVAQFEWACHVVFSAPEYPPFDFKNLAELSERLSDNLHFVLNPASRLIKFHFPILRIVDLCKGEVDDMIDIGEGGVNLLIIRQDLEISLVTLSTADFTFLDMLNENKSVTESLNTALMIDPTFNLEDKLPMWVKDKIIVDCYLANLNEDADSN